MKKVAARKSNSQPPHFHPVIIGAITFFLGIVAVVVLQQVFAGNNDFIIHSCVNKVNGNVRIIDANVSCRVDENPLSWNQQGPQGPQGLTGNSTGNGLPYSCNDCNLSPFAAVFKGKDFSGAQINSSDFSGADLTGVIFKGGFFMFDYFNNTNLTTADFSNMKDDPNFGQIDGLRFTNANLTSANFSNSNFTRSDFTGTNLQGVNFSNTTFNSTNFSGAQNMSTANVTGVTWNNVTCPDGTNSSNHSATCVGHF